MNRRGMLRASAAALSGAGAAVVGLRSSSDSAAAQTALTMDIVGDEATLGREESIAAVWVDCSVEWAYDLPDGVTPSTVVVELAAGAGDGLTTVATAESPSLFGEADGSESFEADLIGAGVLTADQVRNGVDATVEARLRVETDSGDVVAEATAQDTAPVVAETESINASKYGSVGGSGELRIEIA